MPTATQIKRKQRIKDEAMQEFGTMWRGRCAIFFLAGTIFGLAIASVLVEVVMRG